MPVMPNETGVGTTHHDTMLLLQADMDAASTMDRDHHATTAAQQLPSTTRMVDQHNHSRNKWPKGLRAEVHLHGLEHMEGALLKVL
jgi:hypothetical protein